MDAPKFYTHSDGINHESVKGLIEFINNTPGELVTGLNSTGGDTATEALLAKLFDANKERLTLVAMTGVFSAAFKLFAQFEGKRVLTYGVCGMFHLGIRKVSIDDRGKLPYNDDQILHKSQRQSIGTGKKFAKGIMTEKQYKKFKKGDDIFFTFKQMKKMFPDAEIWE